MSSMGPSIRATLGLDTGPLRTSLAQADNAVGRFGKSLKFALGGFLGFTGINAVGNAIKNMAGFAEELNPKLKKTSEELAAIRQAASGLTDDQLAKLSEAGTAWDRLTSKVKGYAAAVVIALREASQTSDEEAADIAAGGTGGFFEKLGKAFQANKPDPEKAAADAAARKDEAIRKKVADIDEDIVSRQQQAAESRLSIAGKIAETERRITEAKAAQVGQADEIVSAEARRKQALEEIALEELKRKQISERADAIQSGADARRQSKRTREDRERAEARAKREIDLESRGGLSKQDFERQQRLKKVEIGEIQGPPAPPKGADPVEVLGGKVLGVLAQIAGNLGVKV